MELIVEDSQCSAQGAVAAYTKLTDVDGVKIILGTSCSSAMLGAAPLAEADGTILFSGLASNPDIANAGDYIFRSQISDIQVGIDTGNQLWADGVRTLATITESTDYAEGVRRTSVAQFEKRGGRSRWIQPHPPEQPGPVQLQLGRACHVGGDTEEDACGLLGQGVRGTGLLPLPQAQ